MDVAPRPEPPRTVLAVCAGVGSLDAGVRLVVPGLRLVGAVERQAYCAAVLVARMADARLDPCPVWDDVATFDGVPWCGRVDLVTAGFPCQPHSVAGAREGTDDDRWLWPDVWRIVREVRARFLFVENVPGLLTSGGLDPILSDLAACGWDAEWDCVPAAAVGAPHLRDRVFLLAANSGERFVRNPDESLTVQGGGGAPAPYDDGGPRDATHADVEGLDVERYRGQLDEGERPTLGDDVDRCDRAGERSSDAATHTAGAGREGTSAAGPPVRPGSGNVGWCDWSSPPVAAFRRVDDGAADGLDRDWSERIHALGNAVVPQAAARAWEILWARLMGGV